MKKPLLIFLVSILLAFCVSSCGNPEAEAQLKEAQARLAEAEKALQAAQDAQAQPTSGLIHAVYFWLKEDLADADRQTFLTGLKSLEQIESVRSFTIGPPAGTENRGVVDNSFDYALIIRFDDVAGHDLYQVHKIHTDFVDASKDAWTKVVVRDNEIE